MLSPVRELDNPNYPSSANETPTHKKLKTLNTELSKINSRRESTVSNPYEPSDKSVIVENHLLSVNEPGTQDEKTPEKSVKSEPTVTKERKISRFKVSVVKEPDISKLVVPADHKLSTVQDKHSAASGKVEQKPEESPATDSQKLQPISVVTDDVTADAKPTTSYDSVNNVPSVVPSLQPTANQINTEKVENVLQLEESVTIINNTMHQLKETLQSSILKQGMHMRNIS